MTFSVLKRHANVIFGLFRGPFRRRNRLSASFTGSSQSHRYVGMNRSHGGNSPFPRRERFVPMCGTGGNHHRNDWLPWREQWVTTKETKGNHEGGTSREVSRALARRKRRPRPKEAEHVREGSGRGFWCFRTTQTIPLEGSKRWRRLSKGAENVSWAFDFVLFCCFWQNIGAFVW